jgi:ketosteroid isomerase-like protein
MTANYSSSPKEFLQPSRFHRKSSLYPGLLLMLIGVIFTFMLTCCTSTPTPDPISIVQLANDRLNQEDVDGYMELFSADAVMVDPHGTYEGTEVIREYIEKEVVPKNYRFELRDLSTNGNDVTYTYDIYVNDILRDTSTDGLDVVVNGKIIFEGTVKLRRFMCISDPAAAYCPEEE